MFRTETTVEMLKPIALIVGLAIVLWSLGLPSLRFVDAANLTDVKDTLTDSAPSAASNHTIEFVSPTGVPNSQDIVIDLTSFDLSYIGEEDIDLLINGVNRTNADWSVATTANDITISIDTGSIAAGATTTVLIGLHATNEGSPNTQIDNPAAEASYPIGITAGTADSGETRVVILTAVTVTASVDTIFTFEVSGVNAGGTVNGETITGNTGSTSIPFGVLDDSGPTTSAQLLSVGTNAANGYVVTVQTDTPFWSTTGAIIDGFNNGSDADTPTSWAAPSGLVASPNTWGHWGVTSDDTDIDDYGTQFGNGLFIAASTTPRQIMQHDGPVNNAGVGIGTTTVAYKVQISALQEAADDYSTTLTYIATPTF
jgi:hypothetical protein